MSLRPIALNDLPMPGQVRLEAPGYSRTVIAVNGRAGFPDVPQSMKAANLFITNEHDINLPIPGYEWYGEVISVPASPTNDWWAIEIPAAYPRPLPFTWYQLPKLLVSATPMPPPFTPAPRYWRGNMCGMRVSGLPAVSGGANDASLVLSWFYDRYNSLDRAIIRAAWKARNYTHVLLSWPDSRAYGQSALDFQATCLELIADGFFPCPMLCSKDFDPHNTAGVMANINPVLPMLIGIVPLVCIGWELSLWLSPTQVQELIDQIAPQFTPAGTRVYVHFQEAYMAFQQPGHFIADFWKANVGKLEGVLAQKRLSHNNAQFRDWIHDCLLRCAGGFNMPADCGFGHPVDFVMLEISAQPQFNGGMSEADGDSLGQFAINSPAVSGPAGIVGVQGSGNGSIL